ncbi:hypothetical protein LSH36_186g01074 [Paralvinella palmiformis]|uniref:Ankyrin repeat protein n=1 Tax=Paralvinella palmiformis TaxID=53620 RepID=A0AAD9JR54_9ANNE|nr:hypothetical protein LSH36_186g01074 [Paralvinella palmiformis]
MVQLLIQNLKEYGSDVKGFGVFLERFSREHEAFLGNISEIFVCTVSRQCVHLAEILLDRTCNIQLLECLLRRGANVTVTTASEEGALDLVCEQKSPECVQLILDHLNEQGLDQQSKDVVRYNGLMTAAYSGHDDILDILLANGLDVNLNLDEDLGADVESFRRNVEQTPLMRAAEFGHLDIVCRLLAEGAETIVRILIQSGAVLDEKCGERGEAAIHLAAVIGLYETVELLLDNGADINVLTDYNETALWLAVCKGHVSVSRLLIGRNCKIGVPSNGCQVYAVDYVEIELSMGLNLFPITRMLLLAGCPLINRVYFCPDDPGPVGIVPWIRLRPESLEIQQGREEQFRWIVDFVSNARTLKDLCTLHIRRILGVQLEEKLRSLTLPEDLIYHVCFMHF